MVSEKDTQQSPSCHSNTADEAWYWPKHILRSEWLCIICMTVHYFLLPVGSTAVPQMQPWLLPVVVVFVCVMVLSCVVIIIIVGVVMLRRRQSSKYSVHWFSLMIVLCLPFVSYWVHFLFIVFTTLIFTCMMMHHYRHSRSSSSSHPPPPSPMRDLYLLGTCMLYSPYKKHCELTLYIVLTNNTQFSWNGLHWWFYLQYTSLLLDVGQGCSHQLWSGQVSTVYTCRHTTSREIWGHVSHLPSPP